VEGVAKVVLVEDRLAVAELATPHLDGDPLELGFIDAGKQAARSERIDADPDLRQSAHRAAC
jgi:hypothetical protein